MTLIGRLYCHFGKHEPDRRKVRHDGMEFVGHCRHCGVALERRGHQDWIVPPPEQPSTLH